jgi:FkbM family methyltransferase
VAKQSVAEVSILLSIKATQSPLALTGSPLLKTALKRIPGARAAYRRAFGLDKPGAWLYRASTLGWMDDPSLRSQLPVSYRLLALYYRAQKHSPAPVLGGALAFDLASRVLDDDGGQALRLEIDGRTIFVNPRDPRMLQIPGELRSLGAPTGILRRFLRQGDTFLDIGANHGAFSVAASTVVGSSGFVIAFEPQPVLSALVRRSLEANDVKNFQVIEKACSDEPGEAQFFVPRISSGSAGLYAEFSARDAHDTLTVKLARLDDIVTELELPGQIFIKLDVEGNELAVLRGAREFVRTRKPRILMEINPRAMAAAGTTLDELKALLNDLRCLGYRPLEDLETLRPLDELVEGRHQNALLEFGGSTG